MLNNSNNSNSDENSSGETLGITRLITKFNGSFYKQVNSEIVPDWNMVQNALKDFAHVAKYSNITISNSNNVHLGNKINYDGDLSLNIPSGNNDREITFIQLSTNNQVLLYPESNIYIPAGTILPRSFWSKRIPKQQYDKIEEPVKLVIISHTATSSSSDQAKNIQLIKDIQSFHVDTNNWNDIGYNFLIGCDGSIYEGRGWGVEGAHTFSYNNWSIGIAFIGCFINRMPTTQAINACKILLKRGVAEQHLSRNYKLLGHRQCAPTESPGTKLYEEITKWSHFYDKSIDEQLIPDNEDGR